MTGGRQGPAQKRPPKNLKAFPTSAVQLGDNIYRSTKSPNGFGYFASTVDGRFNVPFPRGTLYVARSSHTAAMERIAAPQPTSAKAGMKARKLGALLRNGKVDEAEATEILLWELNVTKALEKVANLTDKGAALHFPVTAELSSGTDNYAMSQAWAVAFCDEGFDGIEYTSRMTSSTATGDNAIAVFGNSGANDGMFVAMKPAKTLVEVADDVGIGIRRKPAALTRIVHML